MLRHLIYKTSRGEVKDAPIAASPMLKRGQSNVKPGTVTRQFSASSGKGGNALALRLHAETDSDSEDDNFWWSQLFRQNISFQKYEKD